MTELAWWLTNAFNGEWLRIGKAIPKAKGEGFAKLKRGVEEFEGIEETGRS